MSSSLNIHVGTRSSALAVAQVREVLHEIRYFHPRVDFTLHCVITTGDKDRATSLRTLGKTNFFTKELDEGLLRGDFRLAVHAAKDLPEELPEGISIIAITAGKDPRDTLVGKIFPGARVGVSSARREEMVRALEPQIKAVDVRGTIEERLSLVDRGVIDALVVPEAALQRLQIDRPRLFLEGTVADLQGRLAILAGAADLQMKELFAPLDARLKTVYFGLDPSGHPKRGYLTHCPLIETRYTPVLYPDLSTFSALIATSPRAVEALLRSGQRSQHLLAVAVGPRTQSALVAAGFATVIMADEHHAEGVTKILTPLKGKKIFYPHSRRARPIIKNYLVQERFDFCAMPVYDTLNTTLKTATSLEEFDELFFTSPSTVEAFIKIYKKFPEGKRLQAIGPITKETLQCHINSLI